MPSQLQLSPTWGHLQPPAPLLLSANNGPSPSAGRGPPTATSALEVGAQGGLGRGTAAEGTQVGGRHVREALLAHDGSRCPQLSPLMPKSGKLIVNSYNHTAAGLIY